MNIKLRKHNTNEAFTTIIQTLNFLNSFAISLISLGTIVGTTAGTKRSDNTLHTVFTRLRTLVRWCIHQGITKNNPFDVFEIPKAIFGTPFFLTIEERDRIWSHDFSNSPHLAMFRDMFVFHCFIGCRFGDLIRLTNGRKSVSRSACFMAAPLTTSGSTRLLLLHLLALTKWQAVPITMARLLAAI